MMNEKDVVLFKVSNKSNTHKVAEAIYKTYLEGKSIEVQAVGGGAVNQAVKAIAVARSKIVMSGKDIAVVPGFRDIPNLRRKGEEDNDDTITAMNFAIVARGN